MFKQALLVAVLCTLLLASLGSTAAHATDVWPPVLFKAQPTYGDGSDGQITYNLFFASLQHSGDMKDVTIIVPLPEGTRYVSASAQPSVIVSFDGKEVKFFSPTLVKSWIPVASFTVEPLDPAQTRFVTQPWLSWGGKYPGNYLWPKVLTDITKPILPWPKPPQEHLLLESRATIADGIITYRIYPTNLYGRAFDVVVKLPLPDGVKLLSTDAPAFFTASFDGREVSFKAVELPERIQTTLQVKVAVEHAAPPTLVTHAWASWRNNDAGVVHVMPPKGDMRTGDMIVNPHKDGWVTSDAIGDVPLGNYDVTSLAVERAAPNAVDVIYYTRDDIGPLGQPLFFITYISTDCSSGRQFRVVYSHVNGRALLQQWDSAGGGMKVWNAGIPVNVIAAGPRMLDIQVPVPSSTTGSPKFCAISRVIDKSRAYRDPLQTDYVPDSTDPQLLLMTKFVDVLEQTDVSAGDAFRIAYDDLLQLLPDPTRTTPPQGADSQLFTGLEPPQPGSEATYSYLDLLSIDALEATKAAGLLNPGPPPATGAVAGSRQASASAGAKQPAAPAGSANTALPQSAAVTLRGKLAVPIINAYGAYDLHIFAVPGGQELARIADAHQPDFRHDGQRLLFAQESDGSVYEYDLAKGQKTRISDALNNEYPIYDKPGGRVAYGNTGLTLGTPAWKLNSEGKPGFEDQQDGGGSLRSDHIVPGPLLLGALLFGLKHDRPLTGSLSERLYTRNPFLYAQCSLLQPHAEPEVRCRDLQGQGKLIPDALGEIVGRFPVWTARDQIVYDGCNNWAGSQLCGVFTVPAASTRSHSESFILPVRLTDHSDDLPSDSEGNWVAFSSHRDGDWEAYVMDLNGGQVRNLSQSPASNDGLPTLSPDGQWTAFVSDRSGRWAVWVVPTAGGQPTYLFDLPSDAPWGSPWGSGEQGWLSERISWGDGAN